MLTITYSYLCPYSVLLGYFFFFYLYLFFGAISFRCFWSTSYFKKCYMKLIFTIVKYYAKKKQKKKHAVYPQQPDSTPLTARWLWANCACKNTHSAGRTPQAEAKPTKNMYSPSHTQKDIQTKQFLSLSSFQLQNIPVFTLNHTKHNRSVHVTQPPRYSKSSFS